MAPKPAGGYEGAGFLWADLPSFEKGTQMGARSGRAALARRLAVALCAGFCFSVGFAAAQQPEQLRVKGSNTVGGALMPAFIEGFVQAQGWELQTVTETDARLLARALEDGNPVLEINLERLGSSTSFRGLADGSADVGMSSRVIKDKERKQLEKDGLDMRDENSEHVVALDGLAIIVSELNPQLTITPEEIAKVFSGEITNWSALGQSARPIVVHARDKDSGTFDTFKSLALKPFKKKMAETAFRYFSNAEIATKVAADPNAIGFVPLASVKGVKPLALSLACDLIIAPDVFSVKAEEYPLGRRLHLYTLGAPTLPSAKGLIAFAKSDAAQPLVEQVGFVNQALVLQGRSSFSDHLISAMSLAGAAEERKLLAALYGFSRDSDRLSLTFRFQPDKRDILDAKSVSDAERLVRWMNRPENRNRKVRLMGFGGDLSTSKQRAEAARRAILIHAAPGFRFDLLETHGFGPSAPVACPAEDGAPDPNQRVEVWVQR